jgi:acylphosphatase
LELHGRVQGVGFRYTVMQIAQRFAVHGTVRNLRSGALEVDAEGDDAEVDRFIAAVVENPPRSAHVSISEQRTADPRGIKGFGVARG